MPYIKKERRERFDMSLRLLGKGIEQVGDLDYCITKLCKYFMKTIGGLGFKNLALIIGVLICVILETYRRVASPYEDKKRDENGEVYEEEENNEEN